MKSTLLPHPEIDHLIHGIRTEDTLVGFPAEFYFNMIFAGHYLCKSSFSIQRRSMDSILLLLTLQGEGSLHYREKDYSLTPGSLLLINTQNSHAYHACGDGWAFKYLHFRGAMSVEYQSHIEMRFGPVILLKQPLFSEIEEHLDSILQNTEGETPPDHATLSASIYTLLTSLLSTQNAPSPISKSEAAINRAASYIMEHYHRNITTQDVANAVFLSRSYMSEQFTKTYGISPHEYLVAYRLTQVKKQLLTKHVSLQEIAEQNGFRDIYSLSRIFKQKFGLSPSQYRDQIKE